MKDVIRKVGFTVITQGLLGIMTIFTGIVLPKYIGPERYGYLQQFVFYLGYINILGLGLSDGLTLNYAGISKSNIPMEKIRSAIRIQIIYAILITTIILLVTKNASDQNQRFVYMMLGISVLPVMITYTTNAICLALNKSIMYNLINLSQRLIYCVGALICLVNNVKNERLLIGLESFSFVAVMLFMICYCKDFLFGKKESWVNGIKEIKRVCSSGITVTLTIAIMGLLLSFGRILVEYNESIRIYGIYSFYISILSIVFTFTSAIGVIAFPMIKNTEMNLFSKSYLKVSNLFRYFGAVAYYAYVPVYLLIKYYMPEYFEGIESLPILFTTCYTLGKTQVIIVPYFKAYRKEKELLILNVASLSVMIVHLLINYFIFKSVFMIAIATGISIYFYYVLLEYFLQRKVMKVYDKRTVLDLLTPLIFALTTQRSIGTFIVLYTIYIFMIVSVTGLTKLRKKENNGAAK